MAWVMLQATLDDVVVALEGLREALFLAMGVLIGAIAALAFWSNMRG